MIILDKGLAILDPGSDTTCVVKGLANELSFDCRSDDIEMSTVTKKGEMTRMESCNISLHSLHDKDFSTSTEAIVVQQIPLDVSLTPKQMDIDAYPHLSDVIIHEILPTPSEVEVLIGSDLAYTTMPEEGLVKRSGVDQPTGYCTLWG